MSLSSLYDGVGFGDKGKENKGGLDSAQIGKFVFGFWSFFFVFFLQIFSYGRYKCFLLLNIKILFLKRKEI